MLKENHIAWAGGITMAIAAVREQAPWPTAVSVEAETEAQALEASGIQPEELKAYAASGIDLISTSAPVTRSRWLDLSMRFT